ncbi:MAG: hypothetical protein ACREOO_28155 [bacterium]
MNNRIFIRLIFCLALILCGCSKDVPMSSELTQGEQGSVLGKPGATQISGTGFFAGAGECTALPPDALFALTMTGDLEGCLYVFVDFSECSPSGTYREQGRDLFVGQYNGRSGTFRTTYGFEAKYEDCPNLLGEVFGRCQHPIVAGSGTGDFVGVSGRIDLKDDVVAVEFPYRGHLKF